MTDTAGLVDDGVDPIERIGVALARAAMQMADIVLWLGDDAPVMKAIRLWPRCDLPGRRRPPDADQIAISAMTGEGLALLWSLIGAHAAELLPVETEMALNERQRFLLADCLRFLTSDDDDLLIVAEHVRLALRRLDVVTGRSDVEAVLDQLFSRFCVGK